MVEFNLCFELMQRFPKFINVILGLNKMQIEVVDSVKSI